MCGLAALHLSIPARVCLAAKAFSTGEELCTLCIPYDPGAAAPNRTRGKHWSHLHRETEDARKAAMWAHRIAGDPVLKQPLSIQPVLLRGTEMDPDNALAAIKHCTDWFRSRVYPDDTARWVEWLPVRQVTGKAWSGPGWTLLLVRARDAG